MENDQHEQQGNSAEEELKQSKSIIHKLDSTINSKIKKTFDHNYASTLKVSDSSREGLSDFTGHIQRQVEARTNTKIL